MRFLPVEISFFALCAAQVWLLWSQQLTIARVWGWRKGDRVCWTFTRRGVAGGAQRWHAGYVPGGGGVFTGPSMDLCPPVCRPLHRCARPTHTRSSSPNKTHLSHFLLTLYKLQERFKYLNIKRTYWLLKSRRFSRTCLPSRRAVLNTSICSHPMNFKDLFKLLTWTKISLYMYFLYTVLNIHVYILKIAYF